MLAFPGVFQGLLDARASEVSILMLLRAADALAQCVDDEQLDASYIVPSVFDPQVRTYRGGCRSTRSSNGRGTPVSESPS